MVRFNEANGYFSSTDQGRIASHFYIKYDTVEVINEHFRVRQGVEDIRRKEEIFREGVEDIPPNFQRSRLFASSFRHMYHSKLILSGCDDGRRDLKDGVLVDGV